MFFSFKTEHRQIRIMNLEFNYRLVKTPFGCAALCLCHDAELFSENILNALLFSNTEDRVILAFALSDLEGEISLRILFPK